MTDFSGQVLADKYRVDSLMHKDRLGNLYLGTHLLMEKPVAIKILSPALAVDENIVNRFSTEAKTLSRISHPNVLNVTDYGSDKNGTVFIVFESAEGETLKDAVKTDGQFSLERANRITRQIAAALSVAHANGVIHKNLTGENILLTKTANDADFVKVLNFGADSADEEGASDEEISGIDAEYLSPEQCSQTTEADARSDVYSLGVILYEMLAGEVPFASEKPSDVMLKHAQEPPLPLSAFRTDLPNEVNQIIATALSKNPDSRYQTATDLAADLNRVTVLASNPAAAAGAARAYPNLSIPATDAAAAALAADENPQNNIWKTAFILLAGVAVLSGFFIYMTQVKQTNPPTQLTTDANGQPVQPVNPPVGTSEQSLSNMGAYSPEIMSNSNTMVNGIQVMPGGDGYDPWARGGVPPRGAPQGNYGVPMYPPPTGQYYDGNINQTSPFMQDGNTYILVPKNTNTNVNAQPKKTPLANANTQPTTPANTAKPSPTPTTPGAATNTATPAETKPTPTPKNARPTPSPKTSPKNNPTQKNTPSGAELDT